MNWYAYSHLDPVNGSDPTGLGGDGPGGSQATMQPVDPCTGSLLGCGGPSIQPLNVVITGIAIPDGLSEMFNPSEADKYAYFADEIKQNISYNQQLLQEKYENFFNTLYGPATQIASDLGISCVQCILGVAAIESGYYSQPHDVALNNPWGSTIGGGRDMSFSSVNDAAAYWESLNSWRFANNDASTNSMFIGDLQLTPSYNSINPNYYPLLNGIINSVNARMNVWRSEHFPQ